MYNLLIIFLTILIIILFHSVFENYQDYQQEYEMEVKYGGVPNITQMLVEQDEIQDARRAATQSYDLELGYLTDQSILNEIDYHYQSSFD